MSNKLAMFLGLILLGSTLPLSAGKRRAENDPKQPFEVTKTEQIPFTSGGTIRLNNSYGYLTVEGWDKPEVEVTVIKSTDRFYEPSRKEQAVQRFEEVRVVVERRSESELAISTSLPHRNSLFTSALPVGKIVGSSPLPPNNKRGVTVEYRIYVPRNSQLVIQHDNGYVCVSGVTAGIEVHSHTGDMIVMLPDSGPYSIDARTGLGSVSSDFVGRRVKHYLAGTHFSDPGEGPSRRIHLRMGRGSITIKKDAQASHSEGN